MGIFIGMAFKTVPVFLAFMVIIVGGIIVYISFYIFPFLALTRANLLFFLERPENIELTTYCYFGFFKIL